MTRDGTGTMTRWDGHDDAIAERRQEDKRTRGEEGTIAMVTDTRATEVEGEIEAEGGAPARRRAPAKAPGGDDKVQQSIRLTAELRDALKAHADREGIAVNEACTRAIERYLTGAATGQLAEVAAPLIEEAARRAVADELREIKAVLAAHYTLIERTWREAGMTRLEAFALLGNHYGTAYAEQIEGIAEGLVDSALTQGARVARLNLALEADEEADDE